LICIKPDQPLSHYQFKLGFLRKANSYEILIFHPVNAYRTFMRRCLSIAPASARKSEVFMLDILFIVIGLGFLGGAMLYAVACDRM
jgi:hypothetical protein